ncbi:ADP-ribosylation factor family protein [Ancylostoma caninum]|uniref:ADP-ribosylation factor family protein n=1 Tax=Ancylostoma caninum TaxID=29170 RepID=A0A368H5U0_ANCCA|nr:ADP-ribosylation factor family protein [Ancylostoma caninum]
MLKAKVKRFLIVNLIPSVSTNASDRTATRKTTKDLCLVGDGVELLTDEIGEVVLKGFWATAFVYNIFSRGTWKELFLDIFLCRMGSSFSRLLCRGPRTCKIIMAGIDYAGSTTILYQFNLGKAITTVPTTGFNLETISYRDLSFSIWDLGAQGKLPLLWKHYFHNTEAVIFVVDSTDRERVDEARSTLSMILEEPNLRERKFHLLVFANKQDLPNAMTTTEVTKALQLETLENLEWHIQPSNAISGDGLIEGLDWLHSTFVKN